MHELTISQTGFVFFYEFPLLKDIPPQSLHLNMMKYLIWLSLLIIEMPECIKIL